MTSESWLDAIDAAARDMTAARPASDFRARVMERVSATKQTAAPTGAIWAWRGATIGLAAAIVAITFGVIRPFRSVAPAVDLVKTVAAPNPPVAMAEPETTAVAVLAPRRAQPAPAPQPPAGLVEWRSRNIPALIQPAGLSIGQLSVTPLGIAPIVIPPIDEER